MERDEEQEVGNTENLREDATRLRTEALVHDDKSFALVGLVALVALVGTFGSVTVLAGWYIDTAMGGDKASDSTLWLFGGMIGLNLAAVFLLALAGWNLFRAHVKKGAAQVKAKAADLIEAEETELHKRKREAVAAREAAARHEELQERQRLAQEASDAREAQARVAAEAMDREETAQRVSKAVEETRNARRDTRDGRNKPRGSQTQNPGY